MATSTAKKPAAAKAAAKPVISGKAAAAPKPAKATISAPKVTAPAPADAPAAEGHGEKAQGPQLKKKDLIARVVAALDGKKKGQVKDIVEATLATLGEALQNGEALNLPPFGRARIAKSKGEGKASSMTVKLRGAGAKNAAKAPKTALAEVGEDD